MKLFENMNPKVALAFFLVFVAAAMVLLWMLHPPAGDSNALALLAGFVTLFIKMAADAIGYQYSSSAGSDKKDEVQKDVINKLTTGTGAGTTTVEVAAPSVVTATPIAPEPAPPRRA